MKIKATLSTLAAAAILTLNSCAPNTPAARIAKNPALLESLSNSDKKLAQQGKIKQGMHKDGVHIAWGKPAGVTKGSRNGKPFEKWTYTSLSPTYYNNFFPYASYGYGRYGRYGSRYGRYGYGFGYSPQIHYVQRTSAIVEFNKYNKVKEWVTRK